MPLDVNDEWIMYRAHALSALIAKCAPETLVTMGRINPALQNQHIEEISSLATHFADRLTSMPASSDQSS